MHGKALKNMFNYHLLSLTENIFFHHLNSQLPSGKITVYIVYYDVNRMYVVYTRLFSSVRIYWRIYTLAWAEQTSYTDQ
jgi:hypothetical protein